MYKPLLVNVSVSLIVSGVQPHMTVVLYLGHNQSGHNGYQRTYAAIKRLYYWKCMKTQVL